MRKLYSIIIWLFLFFVVIYGTGFLMLPVFAEFGLGSVSDTERLISFIPLVIYISILLIKIITGSRYLIWALFIVIAFEAISFILATNDLNIEKQDISANVSLYKMREEASLLYDDTSGYSNVCEIALAEGGRVYEAKEFNHTQNYFCNDSVEAWVAGVIIARGDGDKIYCADSTGTFGQSSYMLSSSSTKCILRR